MLKTSEETPSPLRSFDSKSSHKINIIMILIIVILTLSLLIGFLILQKISKDPTDRQFQCCCPLVEGSEGMDIEQKQALVLKNKLTCGLIMQLRRQIIEREIIRDENLIGLPADEKLKADIEEYNALVPRLKGYFSEQALRVLIGVFDLKNEEGELYTPHARYYPDIPSDVRKYAEIITDLSLYKNCTELLCSDSRLAFIIYDEGGGSYGMWPYLWHTEYLRDNPDIKEALDRLFELTESIVTSLDDLFENSGFQD
ncbi:MAG: hypothetical protein PHX37_04750 [Eubacteriales bacterium]|nr:hypothetical protein [Eubacteriales bacterium]